MWPEPIPLRDKPCSNLEELRKITAVVHLRVVSDDAKESQGKKVSVRVYPT